MEFNGTIWYWKGPSPFYFVTVPEPQAQELRDMAAMATYGWGMIPANIRIGRTDFYTALWPKDGTYIVPLKVSVRKAEELNEGDEITVHLSVILHQ